DEVGVLVPWKPPSVFDSMTTVQANLILDELRAGVRDEDGKPTGDPFTLTARGGSNRRWAGTVVQRFASCTDRDAKKVLATWLKNGVIHEFEAMTSTSKGVIRKGLRVVESARPGTAK